MAYTVWFTGCPGSGKTTLAYRLAARVEEKTVVLDGDIIRASLCRGLGYSKADRDESVMRIGYVASLLNSLGVNVIVAAIAPFREAREANRQEISQYLEVYCHCPLEERMKRDPKGLYRRAAKGELSDGLTGFDAPYESPEHPDVMVNTDQESPQESLQAVMQALRKRYI